MAEWLGAHMQGWPTWAVIAVLIIASIIWALGELAPNLPTDRNYHIEKRKSHDKK